jgi:hypothetical protein
MAIYYVNNGLSSADAYTVALLHMNGTDTSTTFTDATGKSWTASGNAQIDTAQSKFGGASGLFDGTGDYISTADSSAWQLDDGSNSNSWTIDFWVRFNGDPSAGAQGLVQQYADNDNWWSVFFSADVLYFQIRSAASSLLIVQNTWNPATATWYHVAIVKNGTSGYRMFIDGTQIGTTQIDSDPIPNIAGGLQIARHINLSGTNFYLNGWLDEFRISKGIARWKENFTPPTVSLLHFNAQDGSTFFYDESGKTWTVGGNAQTDTTQSKFGGSSLVLDGTGDYLLGDGSSDFALGTGDGAVDFWLRLNAVGVVKNIVDFRPNATEGDYPVLYLAGDNRLRLFLQSTVRITTTSVLTTGVWYHIALTKIGSTVRLFINGEQEGSTYTDTSSWSVGATGRPTIGIDNLLSSGFNGWIDDFRVTKGSAIWTTNDFSTSLLHFGGTDATTVFQDVNGKTWTANGNVQIDTGFSKFGGASGFFDGSGDYLSVADSDDWQLDGGSDSNSWTVDFWVRFNGDPASNMGFLQQYTDAANNWAILFGSDLLQFIIRIGAVNETLITNAWNPATATWYHVAVVKNGTSGYMMFINGSQIGTTQTDTTTMPNFSGGARIGLYTGGAGVDNYFNGWLDEFRISKGVAVWTSNFTPPTTAYSSFVPPTAESNADFTPSTGEY